MRRTTAIVMLAFVVFGGTGAAEDPGVCLTDDEAELLGMINQYRADNGLPPIPWSKSLSKVGQWHVWDLMTNKPDVDSCNMHSWSGYGLTGPVYWTPVCYTPDHANADGMWDKPDEITGSVYYSNGYEIAVWWSNDISPSVALNWWKGSTPHNDVILNQGIWSGSHNPWAAMGAGMLDNYAVVWFGDQTDPAGTIAACNEVFNDGFEGGNTGEWSTTVGD